MASSLCLKPSPATLASRPRAASPSPRAALPSRRASFPVCNAAAERVDSDWPATFALASFEDVGEYFNAKMLKAATRPDMPLADVMSTNLTTVTPSTSLEEAAKLFDKVTGVPVVEAEGSKKLVGVLSRKDVVGVERASSKKTVADVMSTPPIAAGPTQKVQHAAALMLKHKVHRIPIVNSRAELVGIVTRTDIFTAMLPDAAGGN